MPTFYDYMLTDPDQPAALCTITQASCSSVVRVSFRFHTHWTPGRRFKFKKKDESSEILISSLLNFF